MATRTTAPSRAVPYALIATLLVGILTYVFLGTVSRDLDDSGFDAFSVFWAVSLLVGFGFFAPVEQEITRASAAGADPSVAVRGAVPIALALAAATSGGSVAAGLLTGVTAPGMLVCFALLGPVSAVQFVARGALLSRGRVVAYTNVLVVDVALRVVLAFVAALGIPGAGPEWFAGALLLAIAAAHLWVFARAHRGRSITDSSHRRQAATAILGLLGAGIISQIILNSGPLIIEGSGAGAGASGAFQATFSIARIPLFIVVPLQSLLLPPFVRLFDRGDLDAARSLLLRISLSVSALGAVGAIGAWLLGPWVVELVFGPGRALSAAETSALVFGACLNAGLVVLTQALIAVRRHRFASIAWAGGLVVAVLTFVVMSFAGIAVVGAVCAAFAAGSTAGFAISAVELARPSRTTRSTT